MSKNKSPRNYIILECSQCRLNHDKRISGVGRYLVSKNKKNTPIKLTLNKYCKFCNKHTVHKETK